ncbi:hypothetical protein BD309DRAFT_667050 [Dichomitus squalens]|nr:hypothetical protein BD309DRAFT_667050 [Dichomitus squalens]
MGLGTRCSRAQAAGREQEERDAFSVQSQSQSQVWRSQPQPVAPTLAVTPRRRLQDTRRVQFLSLAHFLARLPGVCLPGFKVRSSACRTAAQAAGAARSTFSSCARFVMPRKSVQKVDGDVGRSL